MNNRIIVKENKIFSIVMIILYGIYLIDTLLINFKKLDIFDLILFVLMTIAILMLKLVFGLNLTFDENGVEIKFLFIKKVYKWNELTSIKYENYSQYKIENTRQFNEPQYKSCIIFSKDKLDKPEWRDPCTHMQRKIFSPFSTFCVNFLFDDKKTKFYLATSVYVADEKEVIEKFKEWNVPIEGLN